MTTIWTVSLALQWLLIGSLCVIVLSLVRQLGVMALRMNPSAGLDIGAGPGPGSEIIAEEIQLFPSGHFEFGGARAQPLLTVFLSPDCSICTKVAGYVRAIASSYDADEVALLVVVSATPRVAREFIEAHGLDRVPVALRQHFPNMLAAKATPFALALAADGFVAARGTPNALEHLEEMLRAAVNARPMTGESTPEVHQWGDSVPQEGDSIRQDEESPVDGANGQIDRQTAGREVAAVASPTMEDPGD